MTDNSSITAYCDEAGTEKGEHYTIAAVILPDAQTDDFNLRINSLKKTYFPDKTPDEVILHYLDIQGRRGIYSKAKMCEDVYSAFRYDLCKLIMEQLKPEIASFYLNKKELSELRNVSIKILEKFPGTVKKKPSAYAMAYFFMILKLQNYFRDKNVKWKIIAEEGNDSFVRLVNYFEKERDNFAFDLVGHLDRSLIGKQCIASKRENAVQIADLVAGTINDWQKNCENMTHFTKTVTNWMQKRILPYESLKEFFVWEEYYSWRVHTVLPR